MRANNRQIPYNTNSNLNNQNYKGDNFSGKLNNYPTYDEHEVNLSRQKLINFYNDRANENNSNQIRNLSNNKSQNPKIIQNNFNIKNNTDKKNYNTYLNKEDNSHRNNYIQNNIHVIDDYNMRNHNPESEIKNIDFNELDQFSPPNNAQININYKETEEKEKLNLFNKNNFDSKLNYGHQRKNDINVLKDYADGLKSKIDDYHSKIINKNNENSYNQNNYSDNNKLNKIKPNNYRDEVNNKERLDNNTKSNFAINEYRNTNDYKSNINNQYLNLNNNSNKNDFNNQVTRTHNIPLHQVNNNSDKYNREKEFSYNSNNLPQSEKREILNRNYSDSKQNKSNEQYKLDEKSKYYLLEKLNQYNENSNKSTNQNKNISGFNNNNKNYNNNYYRNRTTEQIN